MWTEGRRESHQGPSKSPGTFDTPRTRKWTHDTVLWLKGPEYQTIDFHLYFLEEQLIFHEYELRNTNRAFAEGLNQPWRLEAQEVFVSGEEIPQKRCDPLSQAFFSVYTLEDEFLICRKYLADFIYLFALYLGCILHSLLDNH